MNPGPVPPTQIDSPSTHVALSDTESVASEPPPVAATSAVEEPIEFYEGGIIASDAVRTGWNALRAVLRGWGVTEREGLSTWLRNNGFAATVPGNHIAARAQEFIFSEAIAADARVALLEAVYVCYTVHVSRQLAVPPTIRESPRSRVVQRRTSPSSFPDGSWEQMDDLDLSDLFLMRIPMLRSCPHFLRARLRQSFGAALEERHRAKVAGDEQAESRAWKLFGLIPLMLLHRPRGTGSLGRDELARRAELFAEGRWVELIERARQCATPISMTKPELDEGQEQQRRGNAAQRRIQQGQVSRARHELTGATLAPRTRATLDELQQRRLLEQRREIPQPVLDFNPDVPLSLNKELFVSALRSSPSGALQVQEDARTKCSVSVWMTHMCFSSFIQLPRISPGERHQLRDLSSSRR